MKTFTRINVDPNQMAASRASEACVNLLPPLSVW